MKKYYIVSLFFLILILGVFLRFWQLSKIPPGLNRDEASIGYTAYSILKTGKDEYGVRLPISIKSFGDWKLPLYPYLTIPAVAIFGLNEFAVRFPSAIFGVLTIIMVYFLAKELFPRSSIYYYLLVAFFMAISPWHIFFSRAASEANLAVFLTTLGLWLFLLSLKKPKFFPLSFLFLALPLFTYHGNHIFTPLLIIGLLFFYWKEIPKIKNFFIGGTIFLVLFLFILTQTLFSADKTKISGLFPLSDPSVVYQKIIIMRQEHLKFQQIIPSVFHNKITSTITFVVQNYLKGFSTEFLFIRGGNNNQYNIPDFGNLYFWQAPFILVGLIMLIKNQEKKRYFLLYWLLISPIASSLTRDAPNSVRMLAILPVPEILTAYGFYQVLLGLKSFSSRLLFPVGSFLAFLLVLNFFIFIDDYFVHFPYEGITSWGNGFKEAVKEVSPLQNNYHEVVFSRPDYSPYIYFNFYEKIDPEKFQTLVKRYPQTAEGFEHVASFKNLSFRRIDWADDLLIPNRLYVDWVESVPKGATNSATMITAKDMFRLKNEGKDTKDIAVGTVVTTNLINKVFLSNGQLQFYLIETKVK